MKNNNFLLAPMRCAWVASLLLAGCTAVEEPAEVGGANPVPVSFTTRTTEGSSSFAVGDRVNLFVGKTNKQVATAFEFDGSAWLTDDGVGHAAVGEFPTTLTAFYPVSDTAYPGWIGFPTKVSANIDQSTLEKLKACDCMTSDPVTLNAAPTAPIDFTLKHRMCKLTITITGYGEEFGGVLPVLSEEIIVGHGGGIYYDNGEWISSFDEMYNHYPLKSEVDAAKGLYKYEAIVVPETYDAGSDFMFVTIDGAYMEVFVPANQTFTFEAGKAYAFDLVIRKRAMTVGFSTSVPSWDENTEVEL